MSVFKVSIAFYFFLLAAAWISPRRIALQAMAIITKGCHPNLQKKGATRPNKKQYHPYAKEEGFGEIPEKSTYTRAEAHLQPPVRKPILVCTTITVWAAFLHRLHSRDNSVWEFRYSATRLEVGNHVVLIMQDC